MQVEDVEIGVGGGYLDARDVESYLLSPATSLSCALGTRVIDEDLPHGVSRDSKKFGSVVHIEACAGAEPEPGLVDEGRRLESMSRAFPCELAPS